MSHQHFLSSLRAKGSDLFKCKLYKCTCLFTDKASPSVFGRQRWPKLSLWLKVCNKSGQRSERAAIALKRITIVEVPLIKTFNPWFINWSCSVANRPWLYGAASCVSVEQDVPAIERTCSVNLPWINKGQKEEKSQQLFALCRETLSPPFLYAISWMKPEAALSRKFFCCWESTLMFCSQCNSVNELICFVWSSLTQCLMTALYMSASVNCNC